VPVSNFIFKVVAALPIVRVPVQLLKTLTNFTKFDINITPVWTI
jgi:hypothetical protein